MAAQGTACQLADFWVTYRTVLLPSVLACNRKSAVAIWQLWWIDTTIWPDLNMQNSSLRLISALQWAASTACFANLIGRTHCSTIIRLSPCILTCCGIWVCHFRFVLCCPFSTCKHCAAELQSARVLVCRKDVRSLRDLRPAHLPLLRNIMRKSCQVRVSLSGA